MARTILVVAALLWALLGAAGLVVATLGGRELLALLPPLEIDADALGGAIAAVSLGALVVAGAHVAVLAGARRGTRAALAAGALMAALLAAGLLGTGAAALASLVRTPELVGPLAASAAASFVGAVAYGVVTVALVRRLGGDPSAF